MLRTVAVEAQERGLGVCIGGRDMTEAMFESLQLQLLVKRVVRGVALSHRHWFVERYGDPIAGNRRAGRIASRAPARQHKPYRADLTPRERTIYNLLVTGLSRKDIAQRLGLSQNTVRNRTDEIYDILDVHTQRELMQHHWGLAIASELPTSGKSGFPIHLDSITVLFRGKPSS
jgi:DNA-binding CsgD family transcriptional regulator